ncbi:cation transporting ATPase C-terminal domain-containing protein [Streptomyces sp. BRA346]|uniref:cation transporting ATPase C-terminal domain-containing protein n=1 Tax=Streptomyces sp. BRA346 TaxID=2878199 RepID=UPI00406345F2
MWRCAGSPGRRAPLGTRQLLLVNLLTDMLPALAVALARAREDTAGEGPAGEDPLAGGPSPALLGSDLGRILAVRGTATALGAAAAWGCGRMTGRARRARTMGLAALVGTQLGQAFITDCHSPLVLVTGVASAAALFAVIETPVVSHFFGCTPLGPVAWTAVGMCSAGATLGAAAAPRLLVSRRVPCAVRQGQGLTGSLSPFTLFSPCVCSLLPHSGQAGGMEADDVLPVSASVTICSTQRGNPWPTS